jgi:uncharacterized protein
MQLVNEISQTLNIKTNQVETTLKLFAEDCTVPFISRYRKEATGGLDEVQVQAIKDGSDAIIEREKRREYILKTMEEMKKLTPELKKQIQTATTLTVLEDIYAPFKSKRKTKAQLAKEAGHEPLAMDILKGDKSIDELSPKANALKGAADILMEMFAHDVEIKEKLRVIIGMWQLSLQPRKES